MQTIAAKKQDFNQPRLLSVVVPALNEEANVAALVDGLLAVRARILAETPIEAVEYVFVNDGSTDRTLEIMQRYKDAIKIVSFEQNCGYGAALQSGFAAAEGDILAFLDCDCTCDPGSLVKMCQLFFEREADLIIGNRMVRSRSKMPEMRRLGNWLFSHMLTFLSGSKIADTASGIRVFHRSLLTRLNPLPRGLNFTPAMTARAMHEKMRVFEVPVDYAERQGDSKLGVVKHGFQFFWTILEAALRYHPLKIFGAIALLFFFVGALIITPAAYQHLTLQQPPFEENIYRLIAALAAFLTGFHVLLFGVLGGVIVDTFVHPHNRRGLAYLFLDKMRMISHSYIYGAVLFFIGVLVTAIYGVQHFIQGGITLHWSWFILAVGFMLGGIQVLSGSLLVKVMYSIKDNRPEPFH
jgi:glycosyltransferase involved in cell wall biosynthesis